MKNTISKPLSSDQLQRFEKEVKQTDDQLKRLTGTTLLHTGIRVDEYVHMRPWWLSEQNGGRLIEIPEEEECVTGISSTETDNEKQVNPNDRGEPCSRCRNKPSREDDRWHVKTEAAKRTVVVNSTQEELIELLDWWSKGFGSIPLSHEEVNFYLRQLAEEAGLDCDVTVQTLRLTHGRMLSRQGKTVEEITNRLGYSSVRSARKSIAGLG